MDRFTTEEPGGVAGGGGGEGQSGNSQGRHREENSEYLFTTECNPEYKGDHCST